MFDQQHTQIQWSLSAPPQMMDHDQGDRIYTAYFNLRCSPFSITPDPEFLFLSETHRSVLEKIQYGIQSRMGFMLLTGEVGTGKTTLCRALLDHLHDQIRTVYVINPSLNSLELLAGILDDLGVSYPERASKKELIDRLNGYLLANENKNPVVIIVDDAQTIPLETLEDLRLLSNLETDKTKLLQILLVGQPELLINLDQPGMRQLKQRVAICCHLDYLSLDEVNGYIERRLFIAGNQGQIRFASKVIRQVHKQSGGIPRIINKICDMALIAAYTANSYVVLPLHLKTASSELIELQGVKGLARRNSHPGRWMALGLATALLCAMALGLTANKYWALGSRPPAENDHSTAAVDVSPQLKAGPDPGSQDKPSQPLARESRGYVLQLGSFNTLATTLRAVDIYSRKGIPAHWNEVQLGEKGLWYRVFTGRFESIDSVRHYQNAHGLTDAQAVFAPWTVLIERAGSAELIAGIQKQLQSRGVDAYAEPNDGDTVHLYSGAFITQARAQALALKIHLQAGVATQVVNFHPGLVSKYPTAVSKPGGDSS